MLDRGYGIVIITGLSPVFSRLPTVHGPPARRSKATRAHPQQPVVSPPHERGRRQQRIFWRTQSEPALSAAKRINARTVGFSLGFGELRGRAGSMYVKIHTAPLPPGTLRVRSTASRSRSNPKLWAIFRLLLPDKHAPRHIPGAQDAFEVSMIHGILQVARRIAFRCVLHRCGSQDIRR